MRHASRRRIVPAAAATLAVVIAPFVLLLWQSSRHLNFFEGRNTFAGWSNYRELLGDPVFLSSLGVTVRYAVAATIVSLLLGLMAALVVYHAQRGDRWSPLLLAPFLTAPIVVSLIFALLLDGQLGIAPRLLALLGADQPDNIVGHPERVFWALVAIDAWQWFGVFALVLYARMKRIHRRFYELVASSGGGGWRKVVDVWLPSMIPVLGALVLFKFLWSMGDAERIDALTAGGGPHGAMRVFSIWMERTYFRYADYGYGAAAGVLVYVAALVAARFFIRLLKSRREVV